MGTEGGIKNRERETDLLNLPEVSYPRFALLQRRMHGGNGSAKRASGGYRDAGSTESKYTYPLFSKKRQSYDNHFLEFISIFSSPSRTLGDLSRRSSEVSGGRRWSRTRVRRMALFLQACAVSLLRMRLSVTTYFVRLIFPGLLSGWVGTVRGT